MGYKASDIFPVYALNMLLIPVNLVGVLRSIYQGLTGRRSAFGRTPKVQGRTAAAPAILLAIGCLLAVTASTVVADVVNNLWLHGLFVSVNALFLFYGLIRFIGMRDAVIDLLLPLRSFIGTSSVEESGESMIVSNKIQPMPVVLREDK